jgi:hypothetical protein
MKRRQKPVRIAPGPREFIKAWQESSCVAKVAIKMRSTKDACRRRACRYRSLGVPLKYMSDVPAEPVDFDELAEYAASLLSDEDARRLARRSGGEADPATCDVDEPESAMAESMDDVGDLGEESQGRASPSIP